MPRARGVTKSPSPLRDWLWWLDARRRAREGSTTYCLSAGGFASGVGAGASGWGAAPRSSGGAKQSPAQSLVPLTIPTSLQAKHGHSRPRWLALSAAGDHGGSYRGNLEPASTGENLMFMFQPASVRFVVELE